MISLYAVSVMLSGFNILPFSYVEKNNIDVIMSNAHSVNRNISIIFFFSYVILCYT